ncbi:MAG: glycosyltransferase family 2 protein [Roseiflexaceae bacterium]|nr:glycosyltransferase family 2 protein [Roseiflexaceae bacterium]
MNIAVVIPCHNHAHFLAGAVASVVGQTYHDWELIIVDDGSTDHTQQVATQLIARFAGRPIRLISQANRGQGASRNAGIAASAAPFILTLDADDLIAAPFLERTLAALESDPQLGFVTTNVRFFGAEATTWSGGEPSRERMRYDCRMVMAVLFRRSAWAEADGFLEQRARQGYEDWDFWLRLIERGYRGRLVPQELVWYRRSTSSALTQATPNDLRFRAHLIDDHQALYAAGFRIWASAVLRGWEQQRLWSRTLWYSQYLVLIARHAPRELPKALARPAFKALGPHAQQHARALARALGLSRTT